MVINFETRSRKLTSSKPWITSGSCSRQSLPYSLSLLNSHANPPLGTEAFFATILIGDFAHTSAGNEKDTRQNHQYRTRESDFEREGTRGQEVFGRSKTRRKGPPVLQISHVLTTKLNRFRRSKSTLSSISDRFFHFYS